jgi:type VI secretion system protein ImpL
MLRLLRNVKILSSIGFFLLIIVIWLFGHAFGLLAPEQRLAAIVLVMLVWVTGLLVGRVIAARAGALVERMFRSQLDRAVMQATPEQRGEVALLRKQLLEAIATLKKSNLGRTHGNAALYELPWYLIIGHPAAGKSSAIKQSGLVFPIAESGKNAIRGVGGTRNCDWFFTTDGVLLDTAGRYSTQKEDRAEWLEFLRLLKAHRPRTPVNGILVAISLPELTQYKSEGFSEYARQIRARINEIDQVFARKVPVYLVFTKVDLLGGFTQFFEDMTEEQRSQVWGVTLPHEQGMDFDVPAVVLREFDLLCRGLTAIGTDKLASSRNNIERPGLFAFPIEFGSIRNAVGRFVEVLFEDDPYHTHPLLRGVYFTSALQEGAPQIPAGSRVASRFALTQPGFVSGKAENSHSYFLRDLFQSVIFPDQHLVSRQIASRFGSARLAAVAAGVALLLSAAAMWSWSYYENHRFIAKIAQDISIIDTSSLSDRLARLNFIQSYRNKLAQYRREHHPWRLGFGLYQGDALEEKLGLLYRDEVSRLLLDPVKKHLEAQLGLLSPGGSKENKKGVSEPSMLSSEEYYAALKTYLMLHSKPRLEAPYLRDALNKYWHRGVAGLGRAVDAKTTVTLADHVIDYYVRHFLDQQTPTIDNDERLIADSRVYLNGVLRKLSAKDRIYGDIISQASSKYASLNLPRILDNADLDLVSASHTVPGAYTRAAWDGYVGSAIAQASRGTLRDDDWVLDSSQVREQLSAADFEKNYADLLAAYKVAYVREWSRFIGGMSITPFRGLSDAVPGLERLSDVDQSPLRRAFARIAYETGWDNPSLMKKSVDKEDDSIKSAIVNRLLTRADSSDSSNAPDSLGEIEARFSVFARMTSEKDGGPAIVPYLSALTKVKSRLESINNSGAPGKAARALMKSTMESSGSELIEGMQIVDGQMLYGADASMREILKPMLLRPFTSSYGALLPLARSDINQMWQRQVFPYWQALADKYPFADSGNEARLADIAKFLDAGEGTLSKFVEKDLDGMLTRRGNEFAPRRWRNMSVPFSNAFLNGISRASDMSERIFAAGGESRFELQPVPAPGLSEVTLEIDGQQLRYRNGPQLWSSFTWPVAEGAQGARLSVVTFAGVSSTVASVPGRMGWMRLVSQARQVSTGSSSAQLVWTVPSPDRKLGETMTIRFNLRLVSGANPLAMSALRDMNFPQSIIN